MFVAGLPCALDHVPITSGTHFGIVLCSPQMTITNAVMIMFLFGCIQVAQCGLGIRTVADLTQAMYPHLPDSDACVRLLHRNGSAGCSTPGNSAVEGNLWRLSDRDMEAGSGQHIPREEK